MPTLRERLLDWVWPWGRIRRLKRALNQALIDNEVLHRKLDKLTDRDERGRFKR